MKKKILLITAVISLVAILLSFAGCNDSFGMSDIRALIEDNLGWHKMTQTEVAVYDAFDKEGNKFGEYTLTVTRIYKKDVTVKAINEDNDRTLKVFDGYKFTSSLTVDDNPDYVQIAESYTSLSLTPKLSYTRKVDGTTTEIFTSYGEKKAEATFIIDGKTVTSDDKYATSILCDNTYLYQFARVTDMSSSLSVNIPSYTMTSDLTQVYNQAITMSFASSSNVNLDKSFILDKTFSETVTPSGDVTPEVSGDLVNNGTAPSGDAPETSTDESGNVTTTYPLTETNSIPVKSCTFAASKDLNIQAKVMCYISTSPIKNTLEDNAFFKRVIVMIREGDMTYELTSVRYE